MKPTSTLPSNIHIAKPCNQSWDAMALTVNGRFCEFCQKEVIDYREKSPHEIATLMARPGASTCGRFRKNQIGMALPTPEIPRPPRLNWLGWQTAAAAAMLALWQFPHTAYSQATIRPLPNKTQFGPEPPKPLGNTLVSLVLLDQNGNNLSHDVIVTMKLPGGTERQIRTRRGFLSIDLAKRAMPKDIVSIAIQMQTFEPNSSSERQYSLREQSIALQNAQNWVVRTRVGGTLTNESIDGDAMGDWAPAD